MVKLRSWPGRTLAALTLTFDDGFTDTYHETCGWLATRGLTATYFVITKHVGKQFENMQTASWGNWQEAATLNHEIASHGATHAPMAGLASELRRFVVSIYQAPNRIQLLFAFWLRFFALRRHKVVRQAQENRAKISSEPIISRNEIMDQIDNYLVQSYAYPAGKFNKSAQSAVAAAGYASARSLNPGINDSGVNPFALRSLCLGPGFSISHLRPWLDRTLEQSGWLILTFHLVAENNPNQYPYFCSTNDFKSIIHEIERLPFWFAPQEEVARYLWGSLP
jgi:peptidoglycan/xylan/chitin deacetylase (PgdA/CDA1 family)